MHQYPKTSGHLLQSIRRHGERSNTSYHMTLTRLQIRWKLSAPPSTAHHCYPTVNTKQQNILSL